MASLSTQQSSPAGEPGKFHGWWLLTPLVLKLSSAGTEHSAGLPSPAEVSRRLRRLETLKDLIGQVVREATTEDRAANERWKRGHIPLLSSSQIESETQ